MWETQRLHPYEGHRTYQYDELNQLMIRENNGVLGITVLYAPTMAATTS